MPFLLLPLVLLLPLAFVLLLPFSIVQRYRAGTARRLGRPWLARLNIFGISVSLLLFSFGAAVMNFWVPRLFSSAAAGLAGGAIFGLLGLKLTRWEPSGRSLHYTPHRALVLLLTGAVAARILYGFWRAWHAWQNTVAGSSWVAASGAAGSLAMGGVVLGYYFTYWVGIAGRLKRHHRANRWHQTASRPL